MLERNRYWFSFRNGMLCVCNHDDVQRRKEQVLKMADEQTAVNRANVESHARALGRQPSADDLEACIVTSTEIEGSYIPYKKRLWQKAVEDYNEKHGGEIDRRIVEYNVRNHTNPKKLQTVADLSILQARKIKIADSIGVEYPLEEEAFEGVRFYPHNSPHIPASIVAAKFFDVDFDEGVLDVADPTTI